MTRNTMTMLISVLALLVFISGNVYAESCLDTWLQDNSKNMIVNPGFEPDFSGWSGSSSPAGVTTSIDYLIGHDGTTTNAAKAEWDGSSENQNYAHRYQTFNVEPGKTYRLTGFIKTDNIYCEKSSVSDWNGVRLEVQDIINGWKYFNPATGSVYGTKDWTKVASEFTTKPDTTLIRVFLRRYVGVQSGPSYGTAWWDDIQLVPVPAISSLTSLTGSIIINGWSFGSDPGAGNRSSDENCILYSGECLPESHIQSWTDTEIIIVDPGDGAVRVRSGGIVSNMLSVYSGSNMFNNKISVSFNNLTVGEGIGQITDISTGREFLESSITPLPLYEITVKESPFTNAKTVLSSRDASSVTADYSESGELKTITVTGNHCDEFIVTASVSFTSDAGDAQYAVNVQNTGDRVVQSVRYPLIAAKTQLGNGSADDAIVVPYFEGYLFKDPAVSTLSGQYTSTDIEYPGPMTLQMMAYYDTEQPDAGLYLSMDDNEGYKKRFGFERINDGTGDYLLFSFLHVTSEAAGNQLHVPYKVHVDTFSGDWYAAADKYRQWAEGQPWTTVKLANRLDVPQWLFDFKTMIDCYSCPHGDYVSLVEHYQNLLDVQDILLYPGGFWGYHNGYYYLPSGEVRVSWSGIDYFSDDPVYNISEVTNPPYTPLKTAIDDLKSRNSNVLLFIEGFFWDHYFFKMSSSHSGFETCTYLDEATVIPEDILCFDDRPDFYYQYGDSYEVIDENGSARWTKTWGMSDDDKTKYCRKSSTMCVGTQDRNITELVLYNNFRRGIDHGAGLMSLDAIVSGRIYGCWAPDHEHPVGEGKWTHDRYENILDRINSIIAEKGKYGNFGFAMEDPHELYLQDLQFQYVRHSELGSRGNKKIPLFNYIYKDYFIGVDRGMSLGGTNTLNDRWSLAMDFVQAGIQGTMISSDPGYSPNADLIAFYKRLIKMKRKEFYKGRMLHPPAFSILPDDEYVCAKWDGGCRYYHYISPVLTNVIKTDDYTISYLLVNSYPDGSGTYTINFEAKQYDLPGSRVNIQIIKNSVITESLTDVQLAYPVSVELDGGDVVEVRVEYWDFDRDGLNNNKEVLFGTDPFNNDTDGDGITDYDEVCYDGDCDNYDPHPSGGDMSATSQDTDGDGLGDGSDNCPLSLPVRMGGSSQYYSTMQDAYDNAMDSDSIKSQSEILTGDLVLDRPVAVTLEGGYDCSYSTTELATILNGNMIINLGTVTIQDFIIGN